MSTKKASTRVTSAMSFGTFSRHFVHYCYILRAFLGAQLAVILLLGVALATQAFTVTIKEYVHTHGELSRKS